MEKQGKNIKKEINKLVKKAHQKQLEKELSKLAKNFTEWQKKGIDCFELIDKIHDFHDGTARDIWKRYRYMKDKLYLIAIAVVEGHLSETEISNELMQKLEPIIQLYKEQMP
jgi:hypothetical protein